MDDICFRVVVYILTVYDAPVIVGYLVTLIRQVKSACIIAQGFAVQFAITTRWVMGTDIFRPITSEQIIPGSSSITVFVA